MPANSRWDLIQGFKGKSISLLLTPLSVSLSQAVYIGLREMVSRAFHVNLVSSGTSSVWTH